MKAIVTGHSHGLGAAIAADLLGRGIRVLGLARGGAPELARQYPSLLTQAAIDLADGPALGQWLAGGAMARWLAPGGTALLVNNAGTVQPVGALIDQDPLAVGQAVALNVAAPLMLAAALCGVQGVQQRRILHVSSGAGSSAYPGWSVYCATKAALDHHARAAALDAVPGLLVCSLAPGVIDTGMQAQIRATPLSRFPLRERFLAMHRDGALVAPADCARALVDYLLAPSFGQQPVADLRAV
jgi:benzil reductase ((S)-benzoin forming)